MPDPLAPGVFVEETAFRARRIEGLPTSTAGFIGAAAYGPVTQTPVLLTSLADYERLYDPFQPGAGLNFSDAGAAPNHLWHAARAFFAEGGRRLYVSRVFKAGDAAHPAPVGASADGHARVDAAQTGGVHIAARHPGAAGNVRVNLWLAGSANVLAPTAGLAGGPPANVLLVAQDLDLVWVRGTSPAVAGGRLCLLHRAGQGDVWRFEPLPTGTPGGNDASFGLDALRFSAQPGAGDAVQVLTLGLQLLTHDGTRTLARWHGLPLDPRHRAGGGGDSVFDVFARTPQAAVAAPPLVIDRDPATVATAFDVLRALWGADDPTAWLRPATEAALQAGIARRTPLFLQGGHDGQRPGVREFEGQADAESGARLGLRQFEALEDIAMVAAPGSTWGGPSHRGEAAAVAGLLIAHAERMRYRVALLDSGDGMSLGELRAWRGPFDSSHAALYHPWVTVQDPLTQQPLNLPPSGFVAGLCARTDSERGVHKAPANEVVRLAVGLEALLTAAQQDVLNAEGINGFRHLPGRGLRLWGARTLSRHPEWKYLNVRRYLAYLERSLEQGTQWAVFEPHGEALWVQLRQAAEDFLLNEWRGGALLGVQPAQAFFVRCDRTTMTQNDIDQGRLVCLVGVALLKPAEFLIFRIGQHTADGRA
jgi:phage tail sheath protein FI